MTEVEWKLCDGRAAVYAALRAQLAELDVPLRSLWARTPTAGECVSWGEWANRSTEQAVVDELIYQVSVRAQRFDRLHELCDGVNRAMLGGSTLRRTAMRARARGRTPRPSGLDGRWTRGSFAQQQTNKI